MEKHSEGLLTEVVVSLHTEAWLLLLYLCMSAEGDTGVLTIYMSPVYQTLWCCGLIKVHQG